MLEAHIKLRVDTTDDLPLALDLIKPELRGYDGDRGAKWAGLLIKGKDNSKGSMILTSDKLLEVMPALTIDQFQDMLKTLVNLTYDQFKFIYKHSTDSDYLSGKYNKFQHNPVFWALELDFQHLSRLIELLKP